MPVGRRKQPLDLTAEEQRDLEAIAASRSLPQIVPQDVVYES